MKLELEEKAKSAENYRVDNYKLLQRLEALEKRKELALCYLERTH
jgi:hypothetical protein